MTYDPELMTHDPCSSRSCYPWGQPPVNTRAHRAYQLRYSKIPTSFEEWVNVSEISTGSIERKIILFSDWLVWRWFESRPNICCDNPQQDVKSSKKTRSKSMHRTDIDPKTRSRKCWLLTVEAVLQVSSAISNGPEESPNHNRDNCDHFDDKQITQNPADRRCEDIDVENQCD